MPRNPKKLRKLGKKDKQMIIRNFATFGAIFALCIAAWSGASQANGCECSTNAGVTIKIVGPEMRQFEMYDNNGVLVFSEHKAALDAMGGRGSINCGEIYSSNDVVVVRFGHQDDLAYFYGLKRGTNGEIVGVTRNAYLPRDHEASVSVLSRNEFGVLFGRKRDLRMRMCFNPSDGKFRFSEGSRRKMEDGTFHPCNNELYQNPPFVFLSQIVPYGSYSQKPASCAASAATQRPYDVAYELVCNSTSYGRAVGQLTKSSSTSCSDANAEAIQQLRAPNVCDHVVANGTLDSSRKLSTYTCP